MRGREPGDDPEVPPSPDLLLEVLRACALQRGRLGPQLAERMALAFDLLDDWLCHGYPLPADWREALAGPPVRPEVILALPDYPGDEEEPGQQ
jgi:hypothetical protein